MLQLRLVVPPGRAERVRRLLHDDPAVSNLISLGRAAEEPPGEVFLCDIAPDARDSVIARLQEAGLPQRGSIAVSEIDIEISRRTAGEQGSVAGGHALAWESVEAATSQSTTLSATLLGFMAVALLIAAAGIVLDSAILIVGAMIVGPDFGPIAGTCVAIVERRRRVALRSATALGVSFGAGIVVTGAVMAILRATGEIGPRLAEWAGSLSPAVAQVAGGPGFFTFFVAFWAGVAGMLALSTAKSVALIGVVVSVTTIPAAANIGLAAAYGRWHTALGSLEQLAANVVTLVIAGTATLLVQEMAKGWRRSVGAAEEGPSAA